MAAEEDTERQDTSSTRGVRRRPTNGPRSKEVPREAKARDRARISTRTRIASPRPGTSARTRFPTKPDTPRSSEPILIPKLRIQFADFPYLHYSID